MDHMNLSEKGEKHLQAVEKEQDQVKELLRRGAVRHYFLGPENIWTQEGFGYVMGGVFTTIMGGFLLPKLLLYSNTNPAVKVLCWVMTAAGILLLAKGIWEMRKEARKESKPVSDATFDEILSYDIEGLKRRSKVLLKTNIPVLRSEEDLDEMEMIFIKGPRDYTHNVNLPLLWKAGEDGRIRYSNFSTLALYFGKEEMYIYTSIFNMRNGTSKFEHTYQCPYSQVKFVGLEDRTIERVSQQNKSIKENLQLFVISTGDGEEDSLEIPVKDYQAIATLNGVIDTEDAEEAVRKILSKLK